MGLRDSYSRLKGDIKQRLKGKKRKPDLTGVDTPSVGVDSTESLPRPEPHVAGGSSRDRGGDGDNADGQHIDSTDQPVQRYEPEPMSAGDSKNDQEGGTAGVDQEETNQTQYPPPQPDIESTVESGEAEQESLSPSVAPISFPALEGT